MKKKRGLNIMGMIKRAYARGVWGHDPQKIFDKMEKWTTFGAF